MRRWVSTLLVLSCCAPVLADAAARHSALARLHAAAPAVQTVERDGQLLRVFGTTLSTGATAEDSAAAFVRAHSGIYGVDGAELQPGNHFNENLTQPMMYDPQTGTYKFTLVYFAQHRDGLPVYRSDLRVLVRNDAAAGYPVVLAASALQDLGDFRVPAGASGSVAIDAAYDAALARVPGLVRFSDYQLVVYAGTVDNPTTPCLAVVFEADNGQVATSSYQKYEFIADARTGAIIDYESLIYHTDISGTVSGLATQGPKASQCAEESAMRLPYAYVAVQGGSSAYADVNGNFVIPHAGNTQVTVESAMRGIYFRVTNGTVITQQVVPPGPVDFLQNAGNTEFPLAEVNSYLHANVARDFVLVQNPAYPTIANQTNFTINVNINDSCNAYYDGSSINFFRRAGSCGNTGFSVVVHHEYGHHVVQTGGSGQSEYGEGFGDVMGVLIMDDPVLAYGFYYNDCNNGIRTADNNCQYSQSGCSTCGSEIHDCGQLLSGCVWDVRNELKITNPDTYLEILSNLAVNSVLLHSGGSIRADITVDFLTLDDDNGDISDGTPHYAEIAAGFGAHGLPAPPLALLKFTFPNGFPEFVVPDGGTTVRVEVSAMTQDPQPDTGELHYDAGNGWVTIPMVSVSPNVYDAVFPALDCGTQVKYYFSARTSTNQTQNNPPNAPTEYYTSLSATGVTEIFADTFETNLGWTVSNSGGLTSGAWQRAVPNGGGGRCDPPTAFGGSGSCYVTQNGSGDTDVDGGYTYLDSPTFDLSAGNTRLSYVIWYKNDCGGDPNNDLFKVYVSNNNGQNWVLAQTIGPASLETWTPFSLTIDDFVQPTATVRVRFEASDLNSGSVVEAGVDTVVLDAIECDSAILTGDCNCDGNVDFGDINAFVLALSDPAAYATAFPDCNILSADINGDGEVNFGDINPFVGLLSGF